jgi:hypothetical protein
MITMNSSTSGRRVSHATLIAVLLLIFGVFAWGVRSKLSLYAPPGSPAQSLAQAKLLSPKERIHSIQTEQLRPKLLPSSPLLFRDLPIAVIYLDTLPKQFVRTQATASQHTRLTSDIHFSFFFFRPPPAFILAD